MRFPTNRGQKWGAPNLQIQRPTDPTPHLKPSEVENPTNKATASKLRIKGISLSEYGSEVFRVRLIRLSEYGSVAYLVERPTLETRTEQYSDAVLTTIHESPRKSAVTSAARQV